MTGDELIALHGEDRVLIIDGDDLLPMMDDEVRDRVGAIVSALVRMVADIVTIDGFVVREWSGERTIAIDIGDETHEHTVPAGERLDVASVVAVFGRVAGRADVLAVVPMTDGGVAVVRTRP